MKEKSQLLGIAIVVRIIEDKGKGVADKDYPSVLTCRINYRSGFVTRLIHQSSDDTSSEKIIFRFLPLAPSSPFLPMTASTLNDTFLLNCFLIQSLKLFLCLRFD